MPFAARTPCLHPGCNGFALLRGRCAEHAKRKDRERGSTTERGYDAVWEKFRAWFLGRHPLCVGSEPGVIEPGPPPGFDHAALATQVHHKIKLRDRRDLRCVESNCLPQCDTCHAIRTQRGE